MNKSRSTGVEMKASANIVSGFEPVGGGEYLMLTFSRIRGRCRLRSYAQRGRDAFLLMSTQFERPEQLRSVIKLHKAYARWLGVGK